MAHPTDSIVGAMRSPSPEDRALIAHAYDIAEKAHGDEKRKSGEPYITHPLAIALHLAEIGMDRDTVIAGILHDTLEDTTLTAVEIEKEFGASVKLLVEGVTKLSKLKYRGLDRHFESLRRLLVATAADIRVIVIKLADRLHNMETIAFVTPKEKQIRIAKETMEVYAPIAERLGISALKRPLEDLAFETLSPKEYAEAARAINAKREEMEESLTEALQQLKKDLAEGGIRDFKTERRIKGIYSFWKKLEEKDGHIEKIYDLFAVRIIVTSMEDCYRTLGIAQQSCRPIPGRVRDYIASPKPNGYRALHTAVITNRGLTLEIQILTSEMQHENQYGVASHYTYKERGSSKADTHNKQWLKTAVPNLMRTAGASSPKWLRDLTAAVSEQGNETFEEALRQDFFAERMFAFTPKGDVIDLPSGASPVDFAYAVHSTLGDTMVGAKVNGKMVSLDTLLHNGDKVEILTKKNGKPNKKWLEFAKTSGAKKHIRSALKLPPPR